MARNWRPNRIGAPGVNGADSHLKGVLSMADEKENKVEVVNSEGAKLEKWLDIAKKIGVLLGIVIGGVLAAAASGTLTLPAGLLGVLHAVLAVLAGLGLASSGIKPAQSPSLKGPPEP